ncbi:hypothetical protein QE152_g10127 [Popillia japonica]|uniref:Uncharacterized protein n=1 Tax=Popillia japonica TaxID=7064 RepID=A0AAW1LSF3_POPJA
MACDRGDRGLVIRSMQPFKSSDIDIETYVFRMYRTVVRLQELRETVAQFIIGLKQLSKDCQYGTFLDDTLRDNFVKVLEDEQIQGKLLLKEDLKFSRACEIVQHMELTQRENCRYHQEESKKAVTIEERISSTLH